MSKICFYKGKVVNFDGSTIKSVCLSKLLHKVASTKKGREGACGAHIDEEFMSGANEYLPSKTIGKWTEVNWYIIKEGPQKPKKHVK